MMEKPIDGCPSGLSAVTWTRKWILPLPKRARPQFSSAPVHSWNVDLVIMHLLEMHSIAGDISSVLNVLIGDNIACTLWYVHRPPEL